MNWRATLPVVVEKSGAHGQRVIVPVLRPGETPAVIGFLESLSDKDQRTLMGRFEAVSTNGPLACGRQMLHWFEYGDEAVQKMGEFRLRQAGGVRIICFRRTVWGLPSVVLTHGFDKPNQRKTPTPDKNLALTILADFLRVAPSR